MIALTDPAIEAAQRAWVERYSDRLQPVTYSAQHDGMGALAIAAACEALKQVRDELQFVDGVLGLLSHRGLVDTEQNRADVRTALEIVQRYTRG